MMQATDMYSVLRNIPNTQAVTPVIRHDSAGELYRKSIETAPLQTTCLAICFKATKHQGTTTIDLRST